MNYFCKLIVLSCINKRHYYFYYYYPYYYYVISKCQIDDTGFNLVLIIILGCYNSSGIQTTENKVINLSISSPPLCQEHCLQKNYSLFAVQVCTLKLKCMKNGLSIHVSSRTSFHIYRILLSLTRTILAFAYPMVLIAPKTN